MISVHFVPEKLPSVKIILFSVAKCHVTELLKWRQNEYWIGDWTFACPVWSEIVNQWRSSEEWTPGNPSRKRELNTGLSSDCYRCCRTGLRYHVPPMPQHPSQSAARFCCWRLPRQTPAVPSWSWHRSSGRSDVPEKYKQAVEELRQKVTMPPSLSSEWRWVHSIAAFLLQCAASWSSAAADWSNCGFTSHLTQTGHFRNVSPSQFLRLIQKKNYI